MMDCTQTGHSGPDEQDILVFVGRSHDLLEERRTIFQAKKKNENMCSLVCFLEMISFYLC
jgi:hypothetical protein